MDTEAKNAFNRIEAKLDNLKHRIDDVDEELSGMEERFYKEVREEFATVKSNVYKILIIIAVLFSFLLGALLKTFFG